MSKAVRFIAATTLAFACLFFTTPAHASCVNTQESQTLSALDNATSESVVRTIDTCGGDDTSYQVPITTTVTFDGQQFSSVYATTNSVITFGAPDGTYWDYPRTPSISLYSMDWVVFPDRGDEHLVIQTSDGGFRIDIAARPYGMWNYGSFAATNIVITAAINVDGTVAISYAIDGPEYDWSRTGVRLLDGSIVSLQDYGIVHVEKPVVLQPEPVAPTPEPTPSPTPTPQPIIEPPVVNPDPVEPPAPAPIPPVEPLPAPEPVTPPIPVPEPPAPAPEPAPMPIPVESAPPIQPIAPPEIPVSHEEVVAQLAEQAKADDPVVPQEIASIPLIGNAAVAILDAFNALGNVGADMTPEVRETAKKTVIASVIAGNIATTSAVASASITSYRRKQ